MLVENRGSDHSTAVSPGPGVRWGGGESRLCPGPGSWLAPGACQGGRGGAVALHVWPLAVWAALLPHGRDGSVRP